MTAENETTIVAVAAEMISEIDIETEADLVIDDIHPHDLDPALEI